MTAAVVILAGGEGRRIGGGKPNRLLGSERLIDRALRLARSWCDCVAVSARDARQVDVDAEIITDELSVAGPLGGLIAAGRYAGIHGCDYVLTIPADMPFLPNDLLDRLTAEIGRASAAIPASEGELHPVCGLWRPSALTAAPAYAEEQGRSLRGFAASIGFRRVDWSADPHDPFFNINRIEELAEAERRLGG